MPPIKGPPQKRTPRSQDTGEGALVSILPRLFKSDRIPVSRKSRELAEFEFGLIVSMRAFNRWVVRCMAAAGIKDLTTLDVLLLHHVNHRARDKRLGDISFMLNIEDTHVVSYSLKKLASLDLVKSEKRGKEVVFLTTQKGQDYIARYRQIREACLVASLRSDGSQNPELGELARFLRGLSGLYDQAARAATSL